MGYDGPACGHSACRQHWIDSGAAACVEKECGDCIDGWVPGEDGIERCDTCQRFADDDEATAHVAEILRTLWASYGDETQESGAVPLHIRRALREDLDG